MIRSTSIVLLSLLVSNAVSAKSKSKERSTTEPPAPFVFPDRPDRTDIGGSSDDSTSVDVLPINSDKEICFNASKAKFAQLRNQYRSGVKADMQDYEVIAQRIGLLNNGDGDSAYLKEFATQMGSQLANAGAIDYSNDATFWNPASGRDCQSYYEIDQLVYTFNQGDVYCETQRHFAAADASQEYFVVYCGPRRFISFEKHQNIWK